MGTALGLRDFCRQHPVVASVSAGFVMMAVFLLGLAWTTPPAQSAEARAESIRARVGQQRDEATARTQPPPASSAPANLTAPHDDFAYPTSPAQPAPGKGLEAVVQEYVSESEGVLASGELQLEGTGGQGRVTVWLNAAKDTQATRDMAGWQAGACAEKVVKVLVARKFIQPGMRAADGPSVTVYMRIPARPGLTGQELWYVPICARYSYDQDKIVWEELPLEKYRNWVE